MVLDRLVIVALAAVFDFLGVVAIVVAVTQRMHVAYFAALTAVCLFGIGLLTHRLARR